MSAAGGCLCGGVRFTVQGALRPVIACHCSQCRRWTGGYLMTTEAANADIDFAAADTLTWYASSAAAERGFCGRCGSVLFWRRTTGAPTHISLLAGALDPPTGLRLASHIFVADKSDFYHITDGLPQAAQWPER
jgi:hypothetical protein